jgi:predicted molibdopterin-dependent oxidoreductase YjgC
MSISSEKVKRWRKSSKERIIKSFGGECCVCGYNKCTGALALHHLDPSKKELKFGAIRANPVAWPKIVIELRKCVMLCHNCHMEHHYGDLIIPVDAQRFDESFAVY